MSFDISGKTVLITGANRGIGKAFLTTFLEAGARKIYAAVRNTASVSDLVETYGDKVEALPIDLTDPESITAAANIAGDVELVVNNAGVLQTGNPFAEDALETLDFQHNVNVKGLLLVARAFAPVLKANGGGAFVQLNSVASLKSFIDFANYCASKAAAYSLTQALREAFLEQGTTVLSVHPGPIATDMAHSAGFEEVAEPPQIVAESVVKALRKGDFHVFPDSMAREIGAAYAGFSENVIEAVMSEA